MVKDDGQNEHIISKEDADEYYLKVWKSYENVAMHFNDLIIRLRIQSIGGIAALATIIGIVLKGTTGNNETFNYGVAMVATSCLILFWIAIWVLDLRYYNRLLEGSVNAILELEKNKESFLNKKGINLSSNIEKAFNVRFDHENNQEVEARGNESKKPFINGRKWFYIFVLIALVFLLLSLFLCWLIL